MAAPAGLRPYLSVVIPLYNEEETIPELHPRLRAALEELACAYEVVLVDDGSSDATPALIVRLAQDDPRWKVIRLGRNFGQQAAITAGLDYASGENVVILDADLQDPPDLIKDMLRQREQGFDVVYARRTQRHGETLFKRLSARLFYRLMNRFTGLHLPENAGDFRLLSRRAADELRQLREHNRYLRGLTMWIGFRQTAIDYERPARQKEHSKFSFGKMLRFALDAICSFSYLPLRIATLFGLLVSFACALYVLHIFWLRFMDRPLVQGWPSTIVAVLFIGSVQLVCLGIIGEFLGRIYDEVKGRPIYTVMETHNLNSVGRVGLDPPE